MDIVRNDSFFQESLDLTYVPANETTRLYLEHMIPEQTVIDSEINTSPLDNSKSHKEGVSRTYKEFDGYHPIFAYIGQEGYMLNTELRAG